MASSKKVRFFVQGEKYLLTRGGLISVIRTCADIEALMLTLDGNIRGGSESRIVVELKGIRKYLY